MLKNRPLPPHLTISKPQLTSTFPISHRISGAFLATMVLFSPLLCPKMGLISFTYDHFYQSSPSLPKFILSAVDLTTLALCYHMSNGVRHLCRDFAVRKKRGRGALRRSSEKGLMKGLQMSHFSVIFNTVMFLLCTLVYSGLLGIDFHLLWLKIKSMLLGRSFHFLFNRLGWGKGGLMFTIIFSLLDPEVGKMMAPSGASDPSSSSSWTEDSFEIPILLEPF